MRVAAGSLSIDRVTLGGQSERATAGDEEEYVEAVNQRRELTDNDFIDRPETHWMEDELHNGEQRSELVHQRANHRRLTALSSTNCKR